MSNATRRFKVETILASLSAVLFVLTLAWRDWIEIVFRVDPDHGNGALEWLLVALTATVTLSFAPLARAEWQRIRHATA